MTTAEKKRQSFQKIGQYLGCDQRTLEKALEGQQQIRDPREKAYIGKILVDNGSITSEELEAALKKQRLERLSGCGIFTRLTAEELGKISAWVSEVSVAADVEFISQDQPGDCFYILVDGRVSVYRAGDYNEIISLYQAEPGDTIGETGYFSDGRRLAAVKTETPCQFLAIKYEDLDTIFNISPTLTRNFLDLITTRLRRMNLRFQHSVLKEKRAESFLESIYALLDMTEILTLKLGITSQIERIVTTASKLMDAERATLFILDHFSGELWAMVAEGITTKKLIVPMGQGIAGWVAENDQMVNISDAYQDPRFDDTVDRSMGYKTRNLICGPLKNLNGELVGVIQVINKKEGEFSLKDEALFKAFTYQTAIAVENLQLYKKLIADHERMAVLFDISTSVARTLDLDTLFVEIVDKISEVLHAERSSLFLVDRETNEIWSKVAQRSELTEIRFPMGTGLVGHVVETGNVLNIQDAYRDPRFFPVVDRKTGFHTRTVLCAPIINRKGTIIGVAEAMNKKGSEFNLEDQDLLKAVSSQISVALENAQLYGKAVDIKNYLASVQDSITNAIITLDDDFGIVTANGAAGELFGKSVADMAGEDVRTLVGRDNSRITQLIELVYRQIEPVSDCEVALLSTTGRNHYLNINFVPLKSHDGVSRGQVLVFEDITSERRMKSTLVRYMAKDIVDRLLDDPNRQALGGTKGTATIMFSDIRDYTGITESLSAEETVAFLNEYFSLMAGVVSENGGVLDKYIGDAIMSVFGVPYSKDDDPVRAIQAALAMRNRLGLFNARRTSAGKPHIRAGIGICTGEVICGNIGSERRMDFTVIGDSVNVASRVEKLNKYYGTDILISKSTRERLGKVFATRLVDCVRIRGRHNDIEIYEVLGMGDVLRSASEGHFEKGKQYYQEGRFVEAAEHFQKGRTGDPLCDVFFHRCQTLAAGPQPQKWDGIWDFTP